MRLRELWRAWRTRHLLPVEVKKQSVLADLTPRYHTTQAGATRRQHKQVQRYPRRIA